MKKTLQLTIILWGVLLLQLSTQMIAGNRMTTVYFPNEPVVDSTIYCHALFSWQPDSSDYSMIHFSDESFGSGTVNQWLWNFGDPASGANNTSTQQNSVHVFSAAGTYHVCLSIGTSDGCTSQSCDTIHVGPPCNAEFEYQADSVYVLHVHFWDDNMPPGSVLTWYWSFGDGSTSTNADPWHIYSQAGEYTVCLHIATTYGTTCYYCETIQVGTPCNAEFEYEANSEHPLHVHFWDPHMPAGTVLSYYWSFGDSTTSTNADPWHIYAEAGEYTVCLHIATTYGTTCYYCENIYVHSTFDLDGHVTVNSAHADHAMVYLIRIDSINGMTVIDSTEIQDTSALYHFGGVLPGSYYTQAILLPSSVYYGDYIPTYHESAAYWQDANVIYPAGAGFSYNIHMIPVPSYPVGNGTISGFISQGTKINEGGIPSAGVEVLILDPSDNVLGYTVTGSDGKFIFPEIAMGTYSIYPELAGKTTTPASVTLDAANPASDITFIIKGNKITLGISGPATALLNSVSEVFPDPPVNTANINISAVRQSRVTMTIISITGEAVQTIAAVLKPGPNRVSANISQLNSGIYFVRISDETGGQVIRKFVLAK
jgi:PKD repeat protein